MSTDALRQRCDTAGPSRLGAWSAALLLAMLVGCVAPPPRTVPPERVETVPGRPVGTAYRCEDGQRLTVQLDEESARLFGLAGGPDHLLRDAGGLTPAQRVYTGPRLRAEFGLGADGGAAVLHLLQPAPAVLHCRAG